MLPTSKCFRKAGHRVEVWLITPCLAAEPPSGRDQSRPYAMQWENFIIARWTRSTMSLRDGYLRSIKFIKRSAWLIFHIA